MPASADNVVAPIRSTNMTVATRRSSSARPADGVDTRVSCCTPSVTVKRASGGRPRRRRTLTFRRTAATGPRHGGLTMRVSLLTTALLVLRVAVAEAACNSVPQQQVTATAGSMAMAAPTPSPTPTPLFRGRIGTIDQPFVAPGNQVTIRRRGCDEGTPIDPAAVRVTLLVN